MKRTRSRPLQIQTRPELSNTLQLCKELDVPLFLARVLSARGIMSSEETDLSLKHLLPPHGIKGMDRAAERLVKAIDDCEKIVVVGDYDADGATALALCISFLQSVGATELTYQVPDRQKHGYGLSVEFAQLVLEEAPNLVITVDNGISSHAGVALLQENKVDVIVTDHHIAGAKLPPAYEIVNPNLPGNDFGCALAGVGVAFYLMGALRRRMRELDRFAKTGVPEPDLINWLDLVAIGTVADLVPLDWNNRILVQNGLRMIRRGLARPGVLALCDIARRNHATLGTHGISFGIGPLINAAGRLTNISIGIQCLLAQNVAEGVELANELRRINTTRQRIQQINLNSAVMKTEAQRQEEYSGYCIYDGSFHEGVVGIIAGKIVEETGQPAVVFADAQPPSSGLLKGSARSIDGLNIRDLIAEIASRYPALISKYGGHAMAAGLSIKRSNIERFSAKFADAVRSHLHTRTDLGVRLSDGELSANDISIDNVQKINMYAPWGSGFEDPIFHGDFFVISQRRIGDGNHVKMIMKHSDGKIFDAIAFNQDPVDSDMITALYQMQVNEYGGLRTVQLVIDAMQVT